uniref:Uncharacterized protein n=1 Tax=Romanomermis culicivorax TaxID=13658 RepID=A0A915L4U4_ROMCU
MSKQGKIFFDIKEIAKPAPAGVRKTKHSSAEPAPGDGQQNFHQRLPKTQSERGTVFDLISMGPVCL